LFICLVITIVLALGLGLVFGAGAKNPIESLMLFIQDSFSDGDGEETLPPVILPELPPLPPVSSGDDTTAPPPEDSGSDTTTGEETTHPDDATTTPPVDETTTPPEPDPDYFKDALFIGDSRTVGFWLYSRIPDATYFGRTSMTVFNMFSANPSETGTGALSLTDLLSRKQYTKIYILLGVNEVGYGIDYVAQTYRTAVEYIKAYQPNAKIMLQSNMHVTAAKSAQNTYGLNNQNLDLLNSRIAAIADNKTVFYLGFEHLFDDETGNLDPSFTGDGVHLYAKRYTIWRDYILNEGRR
jgi:lysophospholipase L1-like esterase